MMVRPNHKYKSKSIKKAIKVRQPKARSIDLLLRVAKLVKMVRTERCQRSMTKRKKTT